MRSRRPFAAFTLIELLVVIAILGVLAALVAPSLVNVRKGDALAAGTREMVDAMARARQLAMSQRTTVFVAFVPPTFWADPGAAAPYPVNAAYTRIPTEELVRVTNVFDKQLRGYAFISLRSVGDQPGQQTVRYLSSWRSLPEGTFVPTWKFALASTQTNYVGKDPVTLLPYPVAAFQYANYLPFPSDRVALINSAKPYVRLPYIAFNYRGQLCSGDGEPLGRDEFIPLAHGSVGYARDPNTRAPLMGPADPVENPPGNSTNSYNLVHIDWLTGRARLEQREIE